MKQGEGLRLGGRRKLFWGHGMSHGRKVGAEVGVEVEARGG